MNKFTIPAILVATVLVAGIFAFMPVEKASTVHTTLQSATAATTAHDLLQTLTASTTQSDAHLNNVKNTFQTALDADVGGTTGNATANCGAAGGGFLVYWTFTNASAPVLTEGGTNAITGLGISNGTGRGADIAVALSLGNTTSISGVMGGTSGATIVFFGNSTGSETGTITFEDTGDLTITVVCQSGSTAGTTP